jgi:hypothetical protein
MGSRAASVAGSGKRDRGIDKTLPERLRRALALGSLIE